MIRFCMVDPSVQGSSLYQDELEASARLSHAARAAHLRRRKLAVTAYTASRHAAPRGENAPATTSLDDRIALWCTPDPLPITKDPFSGLGAVKLPLYLRQTLSDCVQRIWPEQVPCWASFSMHQSGIQLMLSSATVLNCMMTVLPYHSESLRESDGNLREAQLVVDRHKHVAYKLLRQGLQANDVQRVPDGILLGIMIMAVGEPPRYEPAAAPVLAFPSSPLAVSAGMGYCGRNTPPVPALFAAVQGKGFGNITDPFVSGSIRFLDLWLSSSDWRRPEFGWRYPSPLFVAGAAYYPQQSWEVTRSLGTGFRESISLLEATCAQLIKAIDMAVEATRALDLCHGATEVSGSAWNSLVQAGNAAQHALLCVERNIWLVPDVSDTVREYNLHNFDPGTRARDAVQIAVLIYSHLTLFPIPIDHRDVGYELSLRLRVAIETTEEHTRLLDCLSAELVLWIMMIGAMATASSPTDWWVSQVQLAAADTLSLGTTQGFRPIRKLMLRYLWWDHVCLPRGEAVFQRLRRMQSS